MTTNEQARELYKATQDLDAAYQYLLGASNGIEKAHDTMLAGSLEYVFQRIQKAKERIQAVSDPFGTPTQELPNLVEAIRNHAEAV